MTSDNKQFWQKTAWFYGLAMKSSAPLYRKIADRIRPQLKPDTQVLELACGSGQLSRLLAPAAGHWRATDFSPAMIEAAKKQPGCSALEYGVQDATQLPWDDQTFDVAVIDNALHIMPHPELALAEICCVLKPAGLMFAPTFVHSESAGFKPESG